MNVLILSLVLLQGPANPSLFSADSPNLFLFRDQKARGRLAMHALEVASRLHRWTVWKE